VRGAHYKPDDVAYYAIDLRKDAASAAAVAGGGDDADEEKAFLEDRTRNGSNINNNSRQVGVHVRSPQRAGPVLARLDENKEAVGRLSPIARRDDLMPASARKHLVARRKDPVYEKQKKLAGPQLHDHLCADLLQPGMAGISTVFFSDKMSSSREPKPLVMPLPVPSTPLAF
jgi:hypothetical protein